MSKIHDEAWAEEMLNSPPPKGYGMNIAEGIALMDISDPVYAIAAAYNYGFIRGQQYEKAQARKARNA